MWMFAAGCAFLGTGPDMPRPPSSPDSVYLSSVPFHAQKKYQCGPAALAMVLNWSGVDIAPDDLVPIVYVPERKGAFQTGLITAARRHQRLAYPIKGPECLLREIAARRPVLVLQNLGLKWLPRWHYAVVVGYDAIQNYLVLHTGETATRQVGFRTFMNTWKRAGYWGLLALPVDQMPQCAQEAAYLKAAYGLQIAGHVQTAIRAYQKAAAHWPQSDEAYMALGNACYLEGTTQKAMDAFARAIQIKPDNGAALNNLAHLLAESGQFEKAEAMVLKAIDISGPHIEVYRQTLEEIRSKKIGSSPN